MGIFDGMPGQPVFQHSLCQVLTLGGVQPAGLPVIPVLLVAAGDHTGHCQVAQQVTRGSPEGLAWCINACKSYDEGAVGGCVTHAGQGVAVMEALGLGADSGPELMSLLGRNGWIASQPLREEEGLVAN